jgi:MFS family permease
MVPDLQLLIITIVGIVLGAFLLSSACLAFFSHRKGYAWYWWVAALGPIGLLALAMLPKIENPVENSKTVDRGNTVGRALSLLGIATVALLMAFVVIYPVITQPPFVIRQLFQGLTRYAVSNIPILLVFTAAIVVGAVRLSHHPRSSKWLIAAGVSGSLSTILQVLVYTTLPSFLSTIASRSNINFAFMFASAIFSLFEAIAIGLIIGAVVVEQSSKEKSAVAVIPKNRPIPTPPDIRII